MKKINDTIYTSIFVVLFLVTIPILLFVEDGTRIVWTMMLPPLPLLIVLIGYYKWRNICPLSFFSKISQNMTFIQKRKVPVWFEENFYLFQFSLLLIAFALRLLILNFSTTALMVFVIFVISASFFINLFFTGKSWCNFFCPVGVVEKIYCLSNAQNIQKNSACERCSACKRDCPDIDMEHNYWKEKESRQKRFVFYAFSGLVFGFYFYFYLHYGTMQSYFDGSWTQKEMGFFSQGFFFAPFIPTILAVFITLIGFSFLSYFIFIEIEKFLLKKEMFQNLTKDAFLHKMKVMSAFVAFNIFYYYAGAPSYSVYPIFYGVFHFIVVMVSTVILSKEILRQEKSFVQDRFALKVMNKSAGEIPPNVNLQEVYYTHINAQKSKKEKMNLYRDTIVDLMEEGILSASSMRLLDSLRKQMDITEKEHTWIVKKLKTRNESLFNNAQENSSESIYQYNTYKGMLEKALRDNKGLSDTQIYDLRKQFCITQEMHNDIMHEILYSNEDMQDEIIGLLKEMNNFRRVHKAIFNDNSREINFLKYVIRNEFNKVSKQLFLKLDLMYKDYQKELRAIKKAFKYKNIGKNSSLKLSKFTFLNEKIAKEITNVQKEFDALIKSKNNEGMVKYLLTVPSIHIATASLVAAMKYKEAFLKEVDLERFKQSDDLAVRNLALKIINKTKDLTTYEGMSYVHQVLLFKDIKFSELKKLVLVMSQKSYKQGDTLIKQGTRGNALFMITSGHVEVTIDDIRVNELKENDHFGDIALLSDMTRIATVKALSEEVKVVMLSKEDFKNFIEKNPEISLKLMKKIIERLIASQKNRLFQ